ncbi:uncharacterized protein B0I36DRAFT_364709 [Microdochium trichocladiopsis]|uniref:Uncharacterized protein n=1 Tax=Microdochium trichocladiopsis TaxID=1682393 RepID=A0A9P9BRQ5_9PEZI|nr:uncharacterized protein B0I36DRAFT_364709 [Microdochium trichocladiopsis]KAH7027520.1 hypothetical protein B0I36DRAFT_364709 [Microdochium trichocladiopsis]
MCRITRLRCQVCQPPWTNAELNGKASSTTERTYRFRPCAQIKRLAASASSLSSSLAATSATSDAGARYGDNRYHGSSSSSDTSKNILPHGTRLHCPNLVWPLPPDSRRAAVEDFICDACLHSGVTHYHWTVREKQLEALRVNTFGQRAPRGDASSSSPAAPAQQQTQQVPLPPNAEGFVLPAASQVQGSFPPEWDTLVSNEMRSRVFAEHIEQLHANSMSSNTFMADALPEADWTPRLSEGPHCHLTLWIPCCKLCREPVLRGGQGERGFEDLEFESNSVLWKWLGRLPERSGMATTISTGFLHKPCAACIEREVALRGRVGWFLRGSDNVHAWAVWHWLLVRGSGQVDFWSHEVANIGLPPGRPWESKFYMTVMAEAWWHRTGLAWEDVGELQPPTTQKDLLTSYHKATALVSLTQWKDLVKFLAPADKFPPAPSLDELETMLGDHMVIDDIPPQEITPVEPPKQPVTRRNVTSALTELQITTTHAKELPRRDRTTLRHCGKVAKRFVTFAGIFIDPATGRAVRMQDYRSGEKHRQDDAATEGSLPKRSRLSGGGQRDDSGDHDDRDDDRLLPPPAFTHVADGYPTPEEPRAVGAGQDEEGSQLVKCRCGYSHMPNGAADAKASWSVELGLRRD